VNCEQFITFYRQPNSILYYYLKMAMNLFLMLLINNLIPFLNHHLMSENKTAFFKIMN